MTFGRSDASPLTNWRAWPRAIFLLLPASIALAQPRTILAIGAHAGDMELTAGATLLKHSKAGDRVVLLHLTMGEGGNPKMSPARYGEQKRREAIAAAKLLGAEVRFGPYADGLIPDDEKARTFVAGEIRRVKPTSIITHWRNSIHKDHSTTHAIVNDAVLLASLEAVVTGDPPYRGVRGVYFAENWEDPVEFRPYLFVGVKEEVERWLEAVRQYEFVRGGISSFPYSDYYEALSRVRGAESGRGRAEAFDVLEFSKKRVADSLP